MGDFIVHDAERSARADAGSGSPRYVTPTSSDGGVNAYRAWHRRFGLSDAPPHTHGPASIENLRPLSRAEQLDPWRVHTRYCGKCRAVLRRAKFARYWGPVMGVGASLLLLTTGGRMRNPLLAWACAAGGLAANCAANRVVLVLEGTGRPSDVDDHNVPNQG